MFATDGSQRLTSFGPLFDKRAKVALPIASVAGLVVAALVAIAFLAMPIAVIEGMAVDSGIASVLTAAAPPLGPTARLAVAFFAGLVAGGATWFGLFLVVGARTMVVRRGEGEDGIPVLRRADAHPDAPPRRPVFANSDLGTPFLEVKADPIEEAPIEPVVVVEARNVPADLDTPIAAYRTPDDVPLPDSEPEPEPIVLPVLTPISAPRFAPHERIETFGLATASADDEPSTPLPQATIHDLLERLERGVARRAPIATEAPAPVAMPTPVVEQRVPEGSLRETLGVLRQLAAQVG